METTDLENGATETTERNRVESGCVELIMRLAAGRARSAREGGSGIPDHTNGGK
jgi:hypothetical protein